eukprot:NODE_822_length_3684_cov_0.348117.p5 type:complete len:113 gc:universal NODE_822_length_3684_cov_0.348117:3113-2775(-)
MPLGPLGLGLIGPLDPLGCTNFNLWGTPPSFCSNPGDNLNTESLSRLNLSNGSLICESKKFENLIPSWQFNVFTKSSFIFDASINIWILVFFILIYRATPCDSSSDIIDEIR